MTTEEVVAAKEREEETGSGVRDKEADVTAKGSAHPVHLQGHQAERGHQAAEGSASVLPGSCTFPSL